MRSEDRTSNYRPLEQRFTLQFLFDEPKAKSNSAKTDAEDQLVSCPIVFSCRKTVFFEDLFHSRIRCWIRSVTPKRFADAASDQTDNKRTRDPCQTDLRSEPETKPSLNAKKQNNEV